MSDLPETNEQTTITITETVQVPAGLLCDDWSAMQVPRDKRLEWSKRANLTKCKHVRRSTTIVTQQDGMGSGGEIDHYTCSIFRVGLWGEIGKGLQKCNQCLQLCKALGESE